MHWRVVEAWTRCQTWRYINGVNETMHRLRFNTLAGEANRPYLHGEPCITAAGPESTPEKMHVVAPCVRCTLDILNAADIRYHLPKKSRGLQPDASCYQLMCFLMAATVASHASAHSRHS